MKRCMFVEDSSVIRKVARRILAGPDLIFIDAASGQEALDICHADMPDIIIVDTTLPDISAPDLIRRIRSIPAEQEPRIAISLTEIDVGMIMRSKRAGAHGYILKPFDRPQLTDSFVNLDIAA
ncbi:response regulator [Mesorhizobium sp. SB112]|uniref:response regulator n=1 Tax=Mesorhizobium sp. SB112 TaxID=3151853 RepID=UPI0032654BAE